MKGLPKRPNGDLCSACKWIGGRSYPLTTTGRISSCVCAKPTRDTPRKKTNIHIRRIKTSNGILAILDHFRRRLVISRTAPSRRLRRRQTGEFLELSGAVAQLLGWDPQVAEQRQLQVGQRRVVGIDEVAAALDGSGTSAYHQRRQRAVGMAIAIADARSIQKDHVIEQRPVAKIGRA